MWRTQPPFNFASRKSAWIKLGHDASIVAVCKTGVMAAESLYSCRITGNGRHVKLQLARGLANDGYKPNCCDSGSNTIIITLAFPSLSQSSQANMNTRAHIRPALSKIILVIAFALAIQLSTTAAAAVSPRTTSRTGIRPTPVPQCSCFGCPCH
jgi:hypothetical protein